MSRAGSKPLASWGLRCGEEMGSKLQAQNPGCSAVLVCTRHRTSGAKTGSLGLAHKESWWCEMINYRRSQSRVRRGIVGAGGGGLGRGMARVPAEPEHQLSSKSVPTAGRQAASLSSTLVPFLPAWLSIFLCINASIFISEASGCGRLQVLCPWWASSLSSGASACARASVGV